MKKNSLQSKYNRRKITTGATLPAVGAALAMVAPSITYAATACPPNTLCNPLLVGSVQDVLYLAVTVATYVGVILAVLALIWVGFKFIAAQGNKEKLTEAREFFYSVIIGIAILIGASAIVSVVQNTLTSAGVVQPSAFGTH